VGLDPVRALFKLKFPREPKLLNAAWTMALGEIIRDFVRLANYPGNADRIFVYIEAASLRKYMAGTARRYGVMLDAEVVSLRPPMLAALPSTARRSIGLALPNHDIHARRIALIPIDRDVSLHVYVFSPSAVPRYSLYTAA
jgi:hypothetical protein